MGDISTTLPSIVTMNTYAVFLSLPQ